MCYPRNKTNEQIKREKERDRESENRFSTIEHKLIATRRQNKSMGKIGDRDK